MDQFTALTVVGLFTGAGYAIAASGLVLVYATTRVFNLAHGALGMVMSFVFWQLSVAAGLSAWLSLVLVVLVIAPLCGLLIERVLMRGLADAPVSVSLVVTVGLFVALVGLAQTIWPPDARAVPEFFGLATIELGSVIVSWHQVLTMLAAVAVAAGCYALLERTRIGTAMRAAIDDPGLLALYGGQAGQVSKISWALGSALGALAGILLAPMLTLDYFQLTFLVINAYTAAVLGKLRSLPWTFVGALLLGLVQSYAVGYLPTDEIFVGLRTVIPTLMLFAVLIFLPPVQFRLGQLRGVSAPAVADLRTSLLAGAALVLGISLLASTVSTSTVLLLGAGLVYALVMLSLVLLTGYSGYVSLAQLSFAGVGALTVCRLGSSSPLAILAAVLVAGLLGVIVAIPVMRLTGLYLALATFAFGKLMDTMVFQSSALGFGFNGQLEAQRLSILGLSFGTERSYLTLLAVTFAAVAVGLLAVRRGRYGRLLIAMRDSPAACDTLGLDPRLFKVLLFGCSAAVAGLAGALWAGLRQTIGSSDFQVTASLPLLLLAVVCGVTTVSGAALGGFALMLLPVLQSQNQVLGGIALLIIGAAAIGLGRNPDGLAPWLISTARVLLRRARGALTPPAAVRTRTSEVSHGGIA